jgi:hypothetical protein
MEQENLIQAEKEKQERIRNQQNKIYQYGNQFNQSNNQYYQPNQNIPNNNIYNNNNNYYNNNGVNNPNYPNQGNQYNNNNINNPNMGLVNQNNNGGPYNPNQYINNPNQYINNPNQYINNPNQNINNPNQYINNPNHIENPNMPIENNNNININNNVNNNNQNLTIINTTESQNNTTEVKRKIKTNSILMMFTWRDLQPRNFISYDYFRNFYNIISSEKLYKELEIHNVTVYLSFHRLVREKDILKFKNLVSERPLIEFIGQHEISECLGRASLVVTDFSSIVFDLMYRKKPYIIYIPDSYDSSLRKIYKPDYWGLIEAMKNNTIKFENKVFSSFETVNKMIFYIQNNFALDDKLERFYQQFGFKMEKSIDKFIDYLVKLN